MKILVIGKGVIGTIYSYLFSKNGHQVEHFVRQNFDSKNLNIHLDLMDEATKKIEKTTYKLNLTNQLSSNYDFVLVSVRHYQLEDVVEKISPFQIPTLVFGNVLDKLQKFRSYFQSSENIIFGMPRGGGSIFDNQLKGAVLKQVILEKKSGSKFSETLANLFQECEREIVFVEKMEDWYWTHLATTVAWICGGVKARGFLEYSKSFKLIYESLEAGKEALEIVKRKGADISVCDDVKPFLLPKWISTLLLFFVFKSDLVQRTSEGHGEYAPDEMTKIFEDILEEGKKLGCKVDALESYRVYFDLMNRYARK